MATKTHRATYRGFGPYKAVVKDEAGKVVAECEHWHRNRDTSSAFAGQSARDCARKMLAEIDPEAHRASLPNWMRDAR